MKTSYQPRFKDYFNELKEKHCFMAPDVDQISQTMRQNNLSIDQVKYIYKQYGIKLTDEQIKAVLKSNRQSSGRKLPRGMIFK